MKKKVTLSVDERLLKGAKIAKLNISAFLEEKLKEYLADYGLKLLLGEVKR